MSLAPPARRRSRGQRRWQLTRRLVMKLPVLCAVAKVTRRHLCLRAWLWKSTTHSLPEPLGGASLQAKSGWGRAQKRTGAQNGKWLLETTTRLTLAVTCMVTAAKPARHFMCSRSGATSIRVRVRWERSVTRPSGRGTGGGCWDDAGRKERGHVDLQRELSLPAVD